MDTSNIFIPNSQQTTEKNLPPDQYWLARLERYFTATASVLFVIGIIATLFGNLPGTATDPILERLLLSSVLLSLALLMAYVALLLQSKAEITRPLGLILLVLMVGWGWLSGYSGGDLFDSVWGGTSWVHTISFVSVLVLIMLLPWFLRLQVRVTTFLLGLIGVCLLLTVLYSLGQLWLGLDWSSNIMLSDTLVSNVNDTAVIAGVLFLTSVISLILLPVRTYVRVGIIGVALVSLVLVALVNLPSLWLGLAAVAVVTALYAVLRRFILQRQAAVTLPIDVKVTLCALALLTVLGAIYSTQIAESLQEQTTTELGFVRPAFSASLTILEQVYKDDMWFGVGPNRYDDAWRLHKEVSINQSQFWNIDFKAGHNYLITFFTTFGLGGGLLLVLFHIYFVWFGSIRLVAPGETKSGTRYLFTVTFVNASFLWFIAYTYSPEALILLLAGLFTGLTFSLASGWYQTAMYHVELVTNRFRGFLLLSIGVIIVATSYVTNNAVIAHYQALHAVDISPDSQNDERIGQLADEQVIALSNLITKAGEESPDQAALLSVSEAALEITRQAVVLDPTNPVHLERLVSLYSTLGVIGVSGGYESALDTLEQLIEVDPRDPKHQLARARVLLRLGDTSAARDALTRATELKPDYVPAILLETELFIAEDTVIEAVESIGAYIVLNPGIAPRHYQLGQLHVALGDTEAAVASFLRAVRLDPVYADARYALAEQYVTQGESERALRQLRLVLETNPANTLIESLIISLEEGETPTFPALLSSRPLLEITVDTSVDTGVLSPDPSDVESEVVTSDE